MPSRYCDNNQNLSHPCKNEITKLLKLLNEIYSCLQRLNVFDTDNIPVWYIHIHKNVINVDNYFIRGNCFSVKGKKGIYLVVGNSCKLECDNKSNIIYIGGQREGEQSLVERIEKFIIAIKTGKRNYHSGGAKIHDKVCNLEPIETCLYVIGFPLKDEHKDKVNKVEGCFQEAYRLSKGRNPCFVDGTVKPDFNIFLIPPDDARRTIQFILTTIDIFFRDCIQDC